MIPLQIGASDMAFARMNNFSFWLLPPAALLLAGSFLVPGGATAAGWTLYAPLSTQMGPGMDMGIFDLSKPLNGSGGWVLAGIQQV